jgi:hypothetical protein
MMWLEDTRFARGRGRLETRFLAHSSDVSAVAIEIGGNGDRVSLIFAAVPALSATIADSVMIGPRQSGQIRPLRVLTPGIAHCAIHMDRDGDVVMGPFSVLGSAEFNSVNVYEVVWHPEE